MTSLCIFLATNISEEYSHKNTTANTVWRFQAFYKTSWQIEFFKFSVHLEEALYPVGAYSGMFFFFIWTLDVVPKMLMIRKNTP